MISKRWALQLKIHIFEHIWICNYLPIQFWLLSSSILISVNKIREKNNAHTKYMYKITKHNSIQFKNAQIDLFIYNSQLVWYTISMKKKLVFCSINYEWDLFHTPIGRISCFSRKFFVPLKFPTLFHWSRQISWITHWTGAKWKTDSILIFKTYILDMTYDNFSSAD